MTTYRYDGSLAGLLTVLSLAREGLETPTAIHTDDVLSEDLFSRTEVVETDEERAWAFRTEVNRRISPDARRRVELAFLATHPGREILIHRFLEQGWQEGARIDRLLAHPRVAPVHRLALKVSREAHRYMGLVRFREVTAGFYYGTIEPEHGVLPLLSPHFCERFRDQHWVIHDLGRGEGLVHPAGERRARLVRLERAATPEYTEREAFFTRLWQGYFAHLAIPDRHNKDLQRSSLPLRHRRHLVEFEDT